MKKNKKMSGIMCQVSGRILLYWICLFPSYFLHAQEVLLHLTRNPILEQEYYKIQNSALKTTPKILNTLSLPFLDDFSKESIYPDTSLWLDSNVFINRDYPIAPPTLGVATFDGVSKSGCPYDTTVLNAGISLPADTFTSKPINLALLPSDSVYLTFFWQAEGRGNSPDQSDSLLLDFFNPTTQAWANRWYQRGYNPSGTDTSFHLVSIPLKDTAYLKNNFQFRFRNYATVSGNVDHWHIDYVLLDKNRNMGDTIFDDVAFVYNSPSLLKNYYAMPWKQYQASEMKTNLNFFIRNNDTTSAGKNISYKDSIFNSSGVVETSHNGGFANVYPYDQIGYNSIAGVNNHPLSYSFPALSDTASFFLKCVLNTTPDKNRWNDTLRFKQNLYNYYAYDDGTVEAGYGLNVFGGQMAYKFTLNNPDTIVAVQIVFNWIPPKVSLTGSFRLRIWNDFGGVPNSVIYEDTIMFPKYHYQFHNDWGNLTNIFHTYLLSIPQKLSGTFYVGLIQYCCNSNNELLNIGYDKNTNSSSKMFYNSGNGWSQTTLAVPGSWMIRPVFGDTAGLMAVQEQYTSSSRFNVFPNPTKGEFKVENQIIDKKIQMVEVYNIFGAKVFDSRNNLIINSVFDISGNPSGIYFLRITDDKGMIHSRKLILTK